MILVTRTTVHQAELNLNHYIQCAPRYYNDLRRYKLKKKKNSGICYDFLKVSKTDTITKKKKKFEDGYSRDSLTEALGESSLSAWVHIILCDV